MNGTKKFPPQSDERVDRDDRQAGHISGITIRDSPCIAPGAVGPGGLLELDRDAVHEVLGQPDRDR